MVTDRSFCYIQACWLSDLESHEVRTYLKCCRRHQLILEQHYLTLCPLGNRHESSAFFSSKWTFSKNSFRNTIRVSNSLDPGQASQITYKGNQQTTLVMKSLTQNKQQKKKKKPKKKTGGRGQELPQSQTTDQPTALQRRILYFCKFCGSCSRSPGAVGGSAVCDCGISFSYSLASYVANNESSEKLTNKTVWVLIDNRLT